MDYLNSPLDSLKSSAKFTTDFFKLEMNKYRVEGRPIFLKLAQPKYRAPRQPKFQGVSGADTFGYYVQQQVQLS